MISRIRIKNFKSIPDLEIPLGRINVLIGANGSGKSNILEAIALVSSYSNAEIDLNRLAQSGVRVARPDLMTCSFKNTKQSNVIRIEIEDENVINKYKISPKDSEFIMTPWKVEVTNSTRQGNNPSVIELAKLIAFINKFEIYSPELQALRGLGAADKHYPIGLHGEDFDVILNMLPIEKKNEIARHVHDVVGWLESITYDKDDTLRQDGFKLGRSKSHLFFSDKYMLRKNNLFSAENANEGALVVLFYLTLLCSDKTPKFFAIDNIDTGLNPRLCRYMVSLLADMAEKNGKQIIVTTHNPAILDGLNLNDENQRLFVINRTDEGYTKVKRIKTKPISKDDLNPMKLSEMWMNGLLGGIPTNF